MSHCALTSLAIDRQTPASNNCRAQGLAGVLERIAGGRREGCGGTRDWSARDLLCSRLPLLCESQCPFGLPRPATSSTTTTKRELSLANPTGQLDPRNRDGCIRERLETRHRRTTSFDRAVVLLNQVVEIFVRPHFDVFPARMLTPQQPQCAATGHVAHRASLCAAREEHSSPVPCERTLAQLRYRGRDGARSRRSCHVCRRRR